jgi:hypothetical protein
VHGQLLPAITYANGEDLGSVTAQAIEDLALVVISSRVLVADMVDDKTNQFVKVIGRHLDTKELSHFSITLFGY